MGDVYVQRTLSTLFWNMWIGRNPFCADRLYLQVVPVSDWNITSPIGLSRFIYVLNLTRFLIVYHCPSVGSHPLNWIQIVLLYYFYVCFISRSLLRNNVKRDFWVLKILVRRFWVLIIFCETRMNITHSVIYLLSCVKWSSSWIKDNEIYRRLSTRRTRGLQ